MEFVETVSGGKNLLKGYMYTKKATKTNGITCRWECANRRGLQCKGAVKTSLQVRW